MEDLTSTQPYPTLPLPVQTESFVYPHDAAKSQEAVIDSGEALLNIRAADIAQLTFVNSEHVGAAMVHLLRLARKYHQDGNFITLEGVSPENADELIEDRIATMISENIAAIKSQDQQSFFDQQLEEFNNMTSRVVSLQTDKANLERVQGIIKGESRLQTLRAVEARAYLEGVLTSEQLVDYDLKMRPVLAATDSVATEEKSLSGNTGETFKHMVTSNFGHAAVAASQKMEQPPHSLEVATVPQEQIA